MPPAHPSSRPYGRNPRRRARSAASDRHQWTDAEPLPCVAQSGKRIIAVEPPGTRRARGIREVARYTRSIPRTMRTTSSRLRRTDASLCRASRSRGRESSQWNRPERAGREWYAASVQLPGRGARLAASGRHWWTEAEPLPCVARPGKEIAAVESPGCAGHEEYVRLHDTPIQPTEQCAQFRTVFDGRTRSLCRASRSREGNRSGEVARNAPGAGGT